MEKIINQEQAALIAKDLETAEKKLVLAGGCFDLLHIGHLTFLRKAKEHGDILIVLLEPDNSIEKTKGIGRPINMQEDRAKILAALDAVDFVIPLSSQMKNDDYDTLITSIKPSIIATTKGDPYRAHKERQAKLVGAKVVDVTPPIKDHSTTRLVSLLKKAYEY